MYWDTISDQWPWFIAAGLVVVLLAVFAAYRFARSTSQVKTTVAIEKKQNGWNPTGRIDLVSTAPAGNFLLQVEDTRIVDSIGGVEHREIRWRSPTLDEVKERVGLLSRPAQTSDDDKFCCEFLKYDPTRSRLWESA